MGERSAKLHYIRGIHFVDKILNKALENGYSMSEEYQFFKDASFKARNNPLGLFDLNNFIFACSVALIGLNKESIEDSDNCKEYGYKIDYEVPSNSPLLKLTYERFKKLNTIETPFSKWLSVTSVSPNIASDNNYLFNVRNSLMHSEYDFEFEGEDSYNYADVNLHNSNYTGFEGKLYVPYYLEFMKHYYSNDAYFGILRNLYVMSDGGIKPTKEHFDIYLGQFSLQKYKYENSENSSKRIEKKFSTPKSKIRESDFEKEDVNITEEHLNKVRLLIEEYYGDKFFELDKDKQGRIVFQTLKYVIDPKTVLSEWIVHYYLCAREAMRKIYPGDDFISVFAADASMLMVKSYLMLYRLQNKHFEDIDYNLIDNIDYKYDSSEPFYTDFKNKLINKGIVVSEDEYKKRYFCEIYRNSLAHGNVKIDVRKENGDVVQYFVFEDIYKSRVRKIEISHEELEKFMNFEAFSRGEAKTKGLDSESRTSSRR